MARPKVTFSKHQYDFDKQAVKYRWVYTIGFLPNVYIGLHLWTVLSFHWTVGTWIMIALFGINALILFFLALYGWKLWLQKRRR